METFDEFAKRAFKETANATDELIKELNLESFPNEQVAAMFRQWLTMAWLKGANWGFNEGCIATIGSLRQGVNRVCDEAQARMQS